MKNYYIIITTLLFSIGLNNSLFAQVTCGSGSATYVLSDDMNSQGNWIGDIGGGNGDWNYNVGPTPSNNTGPYGAFSGVNYIYVETSGGGQPYTSNLVSPAINLSTGLSDAELSFWMHAYGTSIGTLTVGASNSQTGPFTTIFTHSGSLQTAENDPWINNVVNLASYLGQTIYLEFEYVSGNTNEGDIALDFIRVQTCLTCPAPSNLTANNISSDSADLTWNETGSATSWELEWDLAGFTQGTGTSILTSTKPNTLIGLTAATSYDYYVRSICGAGDTSLWSGPYTFRTSFSSPQGVSCTTGNPTIVFSDEMDTQGGWTGDIGTANGEWQFNNGGTFSGGTGPSGAYSGANYIYTEVSGNGQPYTMNIVSPPINLINGLNDAELSFWMHANGLNIGTIDIGVANNIAGPFTPLFTHSGAYQTVDSDPWVNIGVNLASYLGQTIYIQFNYVSGNDYQGDLALDLIEVVTCQTCPAPSNLLVNNLTATTASLNWTENGVASNWQIEYGTSGFVQGAGTTVNINTNPHSLSGLTALSDYDFYVRSVCGIGDSSTWFGPYTFSTPCVSAIAPFFEDVESHTATTNLTNSNCWYAIDNGQYTWDISDNGTTPTGTSGPTSAYSGNNFFFTEATQGNTGDIAELYSPNIDISSLNVPLLEFYYHMFGNTMGDLYIEISDGSSWTTIDSILGSQHSNQVDPWLLRSINLSSFSGIIQIRFRGVRDSFWGDISIDNIEVKEAPTCPVSDSITVSTVSTSIVDISWVVNSSATAWEIEYGLSGFTQGNGTIVNTTNNPYTLTGLASSSTYDFYIRDICGSGDSSIWSGPGIGSTQCASNILAPWTEPFANPELPNCWTEGGAELWEYGSVSLGGFSAYGAEFVRDHTPGGGGTFIGMDGSDNRNGDTSYLISPPIDISALSLPGLKYWVFSNNEDDNTQNELIVELYTGISWVVVDNISQNLDTTWVKRVIDIGNYNIFGDIQVKFTVIGKDPQPWFNDILIDDVTVDELYSCYPTDITATNITGVSLDLSWTENGNATSWVIEFGPSGFTPGTGTTVFTTSNPTSFAGLTEGTSYDFYLLSNCSDGDVTTQFGPTTVNSGFIGFDKDLKNKFEIYPNPTTNNLTIETTLTEKITIEFVTLTGEIVNTFNIRNPQTNIDLAEYSKGSYIIKIISEKGVVFKKLIIE